MKKIVLVFYAVLLLVSAGKDAFAQNQFKIDSLKRELQKFEEQKKLSGASEPQPQDTTKVLIEMELGRRLRINEPAQAADYANEGLALSEKLQYSYGIAYCFDLIGTLQLWKGDFTSALESYNKALAIAKQTKDKDIERICYLDIGTVYSKQGNYPEALNYALKALELAKELKNMGGVFYSYNNIGILYKLQGNYSESLKNYFNCLKMDVVQKDSFNLCAVYTNMGAVYLIANELDSAIKYLNAGLDLALAIPFKQAAASNYADLGTVYQKKENYDAAINNYRLAIQFNEDIKDRDGLAGSYVHMGEAYFKKGDNKNALINIQKGLSIAKEIKALEWMKDAYRNLADIYSFEKNYQAAYGNESLFKLINDSMFNMDREKKLTQLQMKYDFKSEQDSIKAEQAKKDALSETEISNQKKARNYILLIMAIVVGSLVVLIIQRNRIAQVKKQQALEQERMRISRDLHDDLGSGLTGILMMSDQLQSGAANETVHVNIEKIKNSSRQMVDQMGELVWAMNAKNDTLQNLIGYLNTYARDYFENSPITQTVEVPENIPDVTMSGMTRRNIFLVLKESMNNIAKHAEATAISLKIEASANQMMIVITDNGKGFTPGETRRFGNGLKNMQSRMNDIKGSYSIESSAGKGTRTSIRCPLT